MLKVKGRPRHLPKSAPDDWGEAEGRRRCGGGGGEWCKRSGYILPRSRTTGRQIKFAMTLLTVAKKPLMFASKSKTTTSDMLCKN